MLEVSSSCKMSRVKSFVLIHFFSSSKCVEVWMGHVNTNFGCKLRSSFGLARVGWGEKEARLERGGEWGGVGVEKGRVVNTCRLN